MDQVTKIIFLMLCTNRLLTYLILQATHLAIWFVILSLRLSPPPFSDQGATLQSSRSFYYSMLT